MTALQLIHSAAMGHDSARIITAFEGFEGGMYFIQEDEIFVCISDSAYNLAGLLVQEGIWREGGTV